MKEGRRDGSKVDEGRKVNDGRKKGRWTKERKEGKGGWKE